MQKCIICGEDFEDGYAILSPNNKVMSHICYKCMKENLAEVCKICGGLKDFKCGECGEPVCRECAYAIKDGGCLKYVCLECYEKIRFKYKTM